MNISRRGIFFLFFLSGACGLVYELVWTRMLTLVFGTTSLAISTVLTCFFLGLACGSYLGGKIGDRLSSPLRTYGWLELIIGLYAFCFPSLIQLMESSYITASSHLTINFFTGSLLKFFLSCAILIIPTTLMGATFPLLSKYLVRKESKFGLDIGNLYSINTLGAVIGCFIAGFFLIPQTGVKGIIYGTGFVNILIALFAFCIAWRRGTASDTEKIDPSCDLAPPPTYETGGVEDRRLHTILLVGFAISGFSSLALEVVWTKILGMVFTGTIYAFTTVLATYLTGIALGSYLTGKRIDRYQPKKLLLLLGIAEILIGIITLALIIGYVRLPGIFSQIKGLAFIPDTWAYYTGVEVFTAFALLLFPTLLFGASFPLTCKIYTNNLTCVSRSVGTLYAVNTLGAIIGSFAAGFLMIPFIGMQESIIVSAALTIMVGTVYLFMSSQGSKVVKSFFIAGTLLLVFFITTKLPDNMPLAIQKSFLKHGEKVIFYKEGPSATVMIAERQNKNILTSNKRIWVNGNRASAAFYEALQINRFQGILPFFFQQQTEDILVICFGTGTTFGTLSRFDINKATVAEIASTVIEGAPYFSMENHDVLVNPKAEFIIDDGRNFLLTTDRKFDVITQEPMHPALAGVVNLYTKEYYELVKEHLTEGGVMSQWIPLYNMGPDDVKMMVKTFKEVFPHTSIWMVSYDIFLLGSPDKFSVEYDHILKRLNTSAVRDDLVQIDLGDPFEFMNTFLMNEEQVDQYIKGIDTIITDDYPLIEFTTPKQLIRKTVYENIVELVKHSETIFPYLRFSNYSQGDISLIAETIKKKEKARQYTLAGRGFIADGNSREAVKNFQKALSIDRNDRNSIFNMKKLEKMFREQSLQRLNR